MLIMLDDRINSTAPQILRPTATRMTLSEPLMGGDDARKMKNWQKTVRARRRAPPSTSAGLMLSLLPRHVLPCLMCAQSECRGTTRTHISARVQIFMMTFAIPGSIALSVLAGALFGFGYGVALVVFCCLVGACMCYAASMAVGRPLALWLWPVKLRLFQDEVGKRRHRLLWYMAFIRVTPAFPNVFVNVAAPIVGIHFNIFLATTLLGLCVTQSVPVKGGLEISKLNSLSEIYTRSLPMMCMLSMILLAPLLLPLLLRKKGKGRRRADDKLPPVCRKEVTLEILDHARDRQAP